MVVDGEAAEAVAEALRRYGHQGVVIEQRLAEDEGLKAGQRILTETLGVDGQGHIEAAAQIGLGNRAYELIDV